MKVLFNKLAFPVKLILIGLIPLLFVIYLAVQVHIEKKQKIELVKGFAAQLERTSLISKLIDHLQSERRYSFGFAINGKWANEMLIERKSADEILEQLNAVHDGNLAGFHSYSMLEQLPVYRARISQMLENPEAVLSFYTNLIMRLNSLSYISTENIQFLEPISQDLGSQRIVSQMITYLGVMRANLYFDLLSHTDIKESAVSLKKDYDVYLALEKELKSKASPATLMRFGSILRIKDLNQTLAVLNEVLAARPVVHSNNPEGWFVISANAVDALKVFQRELLKKVEDRTLLIETQENDSKQKNLYILILIVALVILLIFYSIKNISETLNILRLMSQKIAMGETGHDIQIPTKDVVGDLARSIQFIDTNNLSLAHAAKEIGQGNFEVSIVPRSEKDAIGNAVVKMKTDLQRYSEENAGKIWIQTGANLIGDSVLGEKDVHSLTSESLEKIASYMGAQTGVFYTASQDVLRYESGYAVADESVIPKTIQFGQSLLGGVAKSKKLSCLTDVPDEYVKISSSTGDVIPRNLLIFPLVHNYKVEGVIELAAFKPFSKLMVGLAELVGPGVAISLQAATSRAKLQELLEETQVQSEELQTQHSELENVNAELEAQAQKLQASEEELRVQQEELQQTNEELEERGSLLTERNIEVQRKAEELELSTKYKSEFLANMSHELRTPLNSILLLSRLLYENNDKNLNEEEIEYARVIQSSGQGLLGLIDEILDLSKIEAGKMEVEFINVRFKDVASEIFSLFQPIAKEKGLLFEVKLEDDLPDTFESDKVRLEQIIKNLLSNALKFTSMGSVTLEIKRYTKDPSRISFVVRDTGIGIPEDKQQHIFEAFQQADGSTKRKFGGTGLGLSISRELSKLLGGQILIASTPGKGSEFSLVLPFVQAESTEEPSPQKVSAYHGEEKITEEIPEEIAPKNSYLSTVIPESVPDDRDEITVKDKTILIIEDDTPFAKVLLDYTRKQGYKGLVAVRGDEGVELASRFKPLGILLDIQLPVKNGWQVMDDLKGNPQTRHIPVHMMSSMKMKNESLLKGAVDFIDKPMAFEGMQEMFKKIEFVLKKESKKVLIIEDNPQHAKALSYFLETFNITSELKKNVTDGVETLKGKDVDCVILDMGIPDAKTYAMLERAKLDPSMESVPIIIFTGKSLSKTEEMRIKKYADSIVVKTAHSYQRMLDEVSLFLHVVEENKKTEQKGNSGKKLGELSQVLHNKTVLIVDDDVRNIFSLSKTLEHYKMNVITAIDGNDALEVMKSNPKIDVVLLDMMMPNMDGYETARHIRENKAWRNLPVIAVTAKAMVGDREKCINAGASDYITKPVDIDQLVSLLRVWLYDQQ